jgi:hypothetical protein
MFHIKMLDTCKYHDKEETTGEMWIVATILVKKYRH